MVQILLCDCCCCRRNRSRLLLIWRDISGKDTLLGLLSLDFKGGQGTVALRVIVVEVVVAPIRWRRVTTT